MTGPLQAVGSTEVAIIGMGCRFPGGASSPEAYWEILQNGVDATGDVPAERWSLRRFFDEDPAVPGKIYTRRGGYLRESIRAFDARFFGISPREAAPMDPQQRLLLEVAWEAFEDAGIVPADLRGSRTGVYVGGFTLDNKIHLLNFLNREAISSHTAISATLVMLSNRLSYAFDLRGPSLTVDTACSSSLVALHLAVQALRQGECDLALAGGASVMFRPAYSVAMCKGGFLSSDGRCKSFDARGDGYGRGEGAGVIVLKPLRAALQDGDPIHAVVLETGLNQDGRTDGITLPSSGAQVDLLRDVCARAGVRPGEISYVEAHGTGTVAGDITEARSLSEALARDRAEDAGALVIGSAKSNIGHLEAAAGVAGVIKAALALEKRKIPPSLHFREPPGSLDFQALRLEVAGKLRGWPPSTGRALAGVNAFGYGGTNAHVLLAEAPAREPVRPAEPVRPLVIPVSARSAESLHRQLLQLHQWLAARPAASLSDLGYTLARKRSHHDHRAAIVASTPGELLGRLHHFLATGEPQVGFAPAPENRLKPAIAFVYTGMGPQSWGMGRELLAADPAAAAALERCDATWTSLAGWSLQELFAEADGRPMSEPRHAQPANFVLQVMLTETLRAYGLAPAAVIGHSTGEVAAAWAAGSLGLEDALRITWHRSRLQETCAGTGRMLAIGLSAGEIRSILPEAIDLAAVNGSRLITVAGAEGDLQALGRWLDERSVWNRMLPVDVPYHSRSMDRLADAFLGSLSPLVAREPQLPLYSTVTGARVRGAEQDASYWWRNLRQPVQFATTLEAMIGDGYNLFLEVGPHPVLAPSILDVLQAARRQGRCLASMRRKESESALLAATMASLFTLGVDFDWSRLYPSGNQVSLMTYPWDREDLWTESEGSRLDRLGSQEHPFLSRRANEAVAAWEGDFSRTFHPFLEDHRIQGEPVFPAAGYVELALAAHRGKSASVAVANLSFQKALATFTTPIVRMHLNEDDGAWTLYSRERKPDAPWHLHATGSLLSTPTPPRQRRIDLPGLRARCPAAFDTRSFYRQTGALGLEYGPAFRCLREGWIGRGEALLRLALDATEAPEAESYYAHPVLLDGAFQSALALTFSADPARPVVSLPVGLRQLRFHRKLRPAVWCHTVLTEEGADLVLCDDDGAPLIELFGLRSRPVLLHPARTPSQSELLSTNRWQAQSADPLEVPGTARWLIFADAAGVGDQLGLEAVARRIACLLVRPGSGWAERSEDRFEIARRSRQDMDRLLREVDAETLTGVVYLWPLDLPDDLEGPAAQITGGTDVADFLHLVQGLAGTGRPETLSITLCTVGTQTVSGREGGETAAGQHALWSAVRTARLELPHLRLKLVDLSSRLPFVAAENLLAELLAASHEAEVSFRQGHRYANRLVRMGPERYRQRFSAPGMRYALESREQGGVRRRGFVEVEPVAPGPGEVEVAVHGIALGEADRLSLQSLPAHALPLLHLQCTGRISAVGEGVETVRAGQEVLVLSPQPKLASHLTVPASAVLGRPAGFPTDDGGTIFDWLEAWYALFEVAGLQTGDWVLIHRANSGLGFAAVHLAHWAQAHVIATVGSDTHRGLVGWLGEDRIGDSSSLEFCDRVDMVTEGRGVDIVLSPLTGELRTASLGTLRDGGTFVDVSPAVRAQAELIPLAFAEAAIRFVRLDLARAHRRNPASLLRALEGLERYRRSPEAREIPIRSFPASAVEEAFHACLYEEHAGRLVVDLANRIVPLAARLPRPAARPDAGYLLTGGFGGVGLETLRWLCAQGARHVGVLSRSGPSSDLSREAVQRLEEDGVRIVHEQVDIADREALDVALERLLEQIPPVRGVIHSAGVLADAGLEAINLFHLDRAMAAKAVGALHLHQAFEHRDLDFFVCYSSIAATLGNVGQLAYAAANGFLHGLIRHRRARGLPGTCIQWGPIADVGMAARDERVAGRLARAGLTPLPPALVFEILGEALAEGWVSFNAADIDWTAWSRQAPLSERWRLSEVLPEDGAAGEEASQVLRNKVFSLDANERRALLFTLVVEISAEAMGIAQSRIDASSTLGELGTDSIMAAEISHAIFARTGVRLRTLYLTRGPSLLDMVEKIEEAILSGAAVPSDPRTA